MTQSRPDMGDVGAFLAVARAGGFRQAARSSGTSSSALSDAVRRLETELGVRLLNRTTRSVVPTEAGKGLIERLAPAFGEIRSALDHAKTLRDRPAGTLTLNVPVSAARLVLPRILPAFLAAYPDISVEILTDERFVDIVAAGCDAGIRYDERLEQDMIAVPIGPRLQRFALGASPDYLARHGRPEHPRELLSHACIRGRFAGRAISAWEFERDGEVVTVDPPGQLVVQAGGGSDLASRRPLPERASWRCSRTGSNPLSTAARWNRCWRPGGRVFPARSSIIPGGGWCLCRSGPSLISSSWITAILRPKPQTEPKWIKFFDVSMNFIAA